VGYVELHARSAFSFLRGASMPADLARAAAACGLAAMALCDRDGVYGAPRFHAAAREEGIRPVVGAELTMEDGSVLVLLVANRTGYRNLCRLITTAQLRHAKGACRASWDDLRAHADGLLALSGDLEGPVAGRLAAGDRTGARAALERIADTFGRDRVWVEIQRHRVRGEERVNRDLVRLAHALDLPLLATNGVCYALPAGRRVQDVFTCLRHHTDLDAAGRLLAVNTERHVRTEAEMRLLFADLPEAVDNSLRVLERIDFTLENLGYRFPDYPVPAGESMDSFLAKICWFGAEHRYGSLTPPVEAQIRRELDLIARLGFSGYFLIVWDIVNFCRQQHIMVQGRGSAANSAVCYSLGITAVDPVGGQLLFERFLSEGRRSWPDIDLDLPSGARREQVIQEVYRRYAPRGAAMTANVITYRGRSAVREIGKVLGFPDEVIGRFAKLFAHGDYPHTLEPGAQMAKAGIRADHPRAHTLLSLYRDIHGLPRHLGQHSGGMIICRGELDTVVPLENASMPGRVVAQWDKDDCEDLGIIKVDLLGLGMMSVLQDAVGMTRERGHPVDLARIPKDDPATYAMLQAADTVGVFQVESRAQMATLPRLKPRCFYDIVVEVAIVRPGPIVGRLAHPYLERRTGKAQVRYIDERVRPVLERTLGVPLFQEQVLKMAMVLADFSGAEAEELRRALSYHRSEERMNRVKVKLREALERKGCEPQVIEEIVATISSFALYGFPESHAISFALLVYASAYLKVHYAAEFYTALLNNQPMGFYSPATIIQDARRHGLRVLAPCVVESARLCHVVDDHTIRLGLATVREVSRVAIEQLLAARSREPFRGVRDLLLRCDLNRTERRALAATGALNALAGDRRTALWAVEADLRQGDLFDDPPTTQPPASVDATTELSPLEVMDHFERLRADYAGMGLTVGTHAMRHIRDRLPKWVRRAADLDTLPDGAPVCVAGAVICRQRPGTAKGVVFISLEDETGVSNHIIYPDLFERERLTIVGAAFLQISGRLQRAEGVTHVKATLIEPMPGRELFESTR